MDLSLRCNSLKCRHRLADRAVVTTCSHIFCMPCSDVLGLTSSTNGVRVCPACDAQLVNPDDAVATQLNPTEDYKTSVLSGLSPTIIMECCSRGISFYQYQVTQEISSMYHDYMAKNLADRYANLNSQMDNVIKDANLEIKGLRDRLERMHLEKKTLEQKNQELVNAFSAKSKAHQRLTKLYQRAKGTHDAEQIRYAAADNVDHVIQSMQGPEYPEVLRDRTPQRSASMPRRGGSQDLPQVYSHSRVGSYGGSKNQVWSSQTARGGLELSPNTGSPSLHSGMPNYGLGASTSGQRQSTPNRQPLGDVNRNATSSQGFGGYSTSGRGVKVGGNMDQQRPQIINRNLARVLNRG
ncbi:hypothetical protein E4T48_01994 [Aureobasidium sp. EXF-10727]|nr:hypothetical protein E4T48_01994 [Aureobasidium sp. EXF-10727]